MKLQTFCVAPWVHASVTTGQELKPCCVSQQESGHTIDTFDQWWNGAKMTQLREDLLSDLRPTDCAECWKHEEQGKPSLRQNYNSMLRQYLDFDTVRENLRNKKFDTIKNPVTWDLSVGNLCNIKCIMCSPSQSDKIQNEILDNVDAFSNFPISIKKAQVSRDKNWTVLPSGQDLLNKLGKDLRWLKLQGGEALAIRSIRDLIENLDSEQTTLSIITNGTVFDSRLIAALGKFKHVQVSISVEAANSSNDVIRYGSDWNVIRSNIDTLVKMPNVELQLNHVLQATSALFLPGVIQYAESLNLHLNLIPLVSPGYLSMNVVSTKHLDQLVKNINDLQINNPKNQHIKSYVLQFLQSANYDLDLFNKFANYVDALDTVREQKLKPILSKLL